MLQRRTCCLHPFIVAICILEVENTLSKEILLKDLTVALLLNFLQLRTLLPERLSLEHALSPQQLCGCFVFADRARGGLQKRHDISSATRFSGCFGQVTFSESH